MNRIGLSGIRRRLSGARASCSCVPATELLHLASSSQAMTYFRWPPKTQLSPCRNRMSYRKKYVLVSSHSARKPKPKFGRPLADSNDAISPVMPPLLNLRYHITGGGIEQNLRPCIRCRSSNYMESASMSEQLPPLNSFAVL